MSKTQTFRVVGGRIHFKCHACQAKRMVTIPPGVRQRSIRCHKCGESTRASFNRRLVLREQQRGKVLVSTTDCSNIEVDLYDISLNGIGFDVSPRDIRKMTIGAQVQFRCTWNPRLLSQGRYIIRSIKGRRIGVERG
ncbi:hypothetical protein FCL47_01915 [Desulfopila sp. IMCC35006]|uniref:hypothetical protein n=1 Tax=Desulfopila sp. IMCC35006 TaxID=2569542 RepID=UPI0010AC9940|nr:hypothetical protein [Desulfopila sp. IMCC35006]TKB28276.1 hypothetical protein FCL47_01915 [Desulfopila sp. IMCC35006]